MVPNGIDHENVLLPEMYGNQNFTGKPGIPESDSIFGFDQKWRKKFDVEGQKMKRNKFNYINHCVIIPNALRTSYKSVDLYTWKLPVYFIQVNLSYLTTKNEAKVMVRSKSYLRISILTKILIFYENFDF